MARTIWKMLMSKGVIAAIWSITINAAYPWQTIHEGPVGAGGYWIFLPDEIPNKPMPVVFFFPGWSASNTINYGNLFLHIISKPVAIAYLPYMDSIATPSWVFVRNAKKSAQAAIDYFTEHTVPIDYGKTIFMGHSAGAILSMNLAADPFPVPAPNLLFPMEPGKVYKGKNNRCCTIPVGNLSKIPPKTKIVMVHGDFGGYFNDHEMGAAFLLEEASSVPEARKVDCQIKSLSDTEVANHFFPSSANPAFDNGTPVGYHLRRADRVNRNSPRFERQYQKRIGRMPTNELDVELWRIFDRALDHLSDDTIKKKDICPSE